MACCYSDSNVAYVECYISYTYDLIPDPPEVVASFGQPCVRLNRRVSRF